MAGLTTRQSHKTPGLTEEKFDADDFETYLAATKESRAQLRMVGWNNLFKAAASFGAVKDGIQTIPEAALKVLSSPGAPASELAAAARVVVVVALRPVFELHDEYVTAAGQHVLRHVVRLSTMLVDGACGDEDETEVEDGLGVLLQAAKLLVAIDGGIEAPIEEIVSLKLQHDSPVTANELLRCAAACLSGETDDENKAIGREIEKRVRAARDASQLEAAVWSLAMVHELNVKAFDTKAVAKFADQRAREPELGGGKEAVKQLINATEAVLDVTQYGKFPSTELTFGKLKRNHDRIIELRITSIVHHEVLRAVRKLLTGEFYYKVVNESPALASYFGAEVLEDLNWGEFYARREVPAIVRKHQRKEAEQRHKGRQSARDAKQSHRGADDVSD